MIDESCGDSEPRVGINRDVSASEHFIVTQSNPVGVPSTAESHVNSLVNPDQGCVSFSLFPDDAEDDSCVEASLMSGESQGNQLFYSDASDLFASDSEAIQNTEKESPHIEASYNTYPFNPETPKCSTSHQPKDIFTSTTSEGSFYRSRAGTLVEKRPEVKISNAFIDLSFSSMPRNFMSFGRDRAKSESGKDNVFAAALRNRVQLPPKTTAAKRVESIKKSLIKLGSFGKDHANGKAKTKKDKDTRSNSDDATLPPLKRTSSDKFGGPFSLALPNLQSQKSPEARLSGRFVTSPLPSCQTNISHPQAVEDPEKLEQFSKQKMNTMQMMYEQARRECEEVKHEYQKKPTEMVHANLEAKVKVVRRLQSQLSMHGGESDTPSVEKRICRRGSSIESSVADGDRDVSTRPPSMPCYMPRHKESETEGKASNKKREVSLTRSHSDSYKGNKKQTGEDRLRSAASSGEIGKITVAKSDELEIDSQQDNDSFGHSKSQDAVSSESSDSALNRFGAASDVPPLTPSSFTYDVLDSTKQQSHIIAIDDYEFNGSDDENSAEFDDSGSPFSDFMLLKNRPAHLAIFLHYLISNSDASPLLFYLVSGQTYSTGTIKELRKWAYEIFSTFLVDEAPLKVKVEESYVEAINDILLNKFDKEDAMRGIFLPVRERFVLPLIKDLLADYRSKRALGLGAIYGESDLREGLDRNGELRVVDNVLWRHFEIAVDDDRERNQVVASVLATYFKQIGCTHARNGHLLERCPTFNTKDKIRFSVFSKGTKRERVLTHRSHNFLPQHYFVVTNCYLCKSVLFGVGCQGYQCQKCDQNFHKSCLEKIKDSCSGKKSKPPNMFDKFVNKKPNSAEEPVEDELGHKDSSTKGADKCDPSKSSDETKILPPQTETFSSDVKMSNEEHQNDTTEIAKSPPPSYTSSLVISFPQYSSTPPDGPPSYSSLQIGGDPELDVEQDLPPLETIITSKEHLKKLDKKEKKRQEIINELFYTEKTHLRDTKVMKLLFYSPMLQDPSLVELADFVFPNINEIVEFHSNLSSEFQQIRNASNYRIVGDFAEILVTNFSGEKGENFKRVCGQFCEKQSQAQEQLKTQQRKDPKLAALLQEAASSSYCRRLTLKDFLPIPMQRLTKYPLLIENLIKHTSADSEECSRLHKALIYSREILSFVNKTVSEYQNRLKLIEIQKKLDTRPIENSVHPVLKEYKNLDLLNHELLFDGLLLWRIRRDRVIPIHVVLLDSILLVLQKQDDKLVLRCEHTMYTAAAAGKDERRKTTHSPILILANVLVRPVATDKCAFFLINVFDSGSQIYDFIASNKEEKNKWCKHINSAVDTIVRKKDLKFPVPRIPVQITTHRTSESESSRAISEKHEGLDAIDDEDEDGAETAEQHLVTSGKNEDQSSDVANSRPLVVESSVHSSSSVDSIEQLKQIDELLRHKMCERMKIWSQLWHDSGMDYNKSELFKDPSMRKHLFIILQETNQMMCLVNSQCTNSGSESGEVQSPISFDADKSALDVDGASMMEGFPSTSQMPFPVAQIVELNNNIHRHLMHLLESVIRSDEERRKLAINLQLAQEKLAIFELSDAHNTQTKYSSNQTLELTSKMTEDLNEKEMHLEDLVPVTSSNEFFDSALATSETSSANEFDLRITPAAVSDSNKSDFVTGTSVTLASDYTDYTSSTDA